MRLSRRLVSIYCAGLLLSLGVGLLGVILAVYLSRAGVSTATIGAVIGVCLLGACAATTWVVWAVSVLVVARLWSLSLSGGNRWRLRNGQSPFVSGPARPGLRGNGEATRESGIAVLSLYEPNCTVVAASPAALGCSRDSRPQVGLKCSPLYSMANLQMKELWASLEAKPSQAAEQSGPFARRSPRSVT
jgi:hypothetical protein